MGKTTLYHPVSLHVIRGAAEYCGWKIGRIVQLDSNKDTGSASYQTRIDRVPAGLVDYGPSVIQRQFQHCFAQDIQVNHVTMTSEGQAWATINVQLQPESPDLPGDKLPWED